MENKEEENIENQLKQVESETSHNVDASSTPSPDMAHADNFGDGKEIPKPILEKQEEEFTHLIPDTSFFCGEKLPNGEIIYCEECRLRKEKEMGFPIKQEPIEISKEIIEDKNENNNKT